jgi:hypothetical protein
VRHAVGRSSPIHSAGRFAVPRGSAPSAFSTSSAGALTTRSGVDRNQMSGDRRVPSSSLPARTPTAEGSRTIQSGARPARPTGDRAVSRERAAPDSAIGAPSNSAVGSGVEPRASRRAPEVGRPSEGSSDRAVTAAPYGAVRVAPRVRQPSDPARIDPQAIPSDRARMREERAPAYSAPSAPQSSRPSAPEAGVYRSTPGDRRAPEVDGGAEYRGRAVPRSEPAPSVPAYRSAPEQRRGPSGPPPSAAPARESGPSGDRAPAAGARQRSGEARSTGQGARSRR